MSQISPQQIKEAIKAADDAVVDYIIEGDEWLDNDTSVILTAQSYGMEAAEVKILHENVKYAVLGIVSLDSTVDEILDESSSDEDSILSYLFATLKEMPQEVQNKLRSYPINKDIDKDFPGLFSNPVAMSNNADNSQNPATPAEQSVAQGNNELDRSDILSGIENPSNSISQPSTVLPKSKPTTSSILASLADKPTQSLDAESEDIQIIDPFKIKGTVPQAKGVETSMVSTQIPISPEQEPKTTAINNDISGIPATQAIKAQMANKLQSVAASPAEEKYKVVSDPYREPVE